MKRHMNHTATIGMLAILIGVGAGAPEALAGAGVCTVCRSCTDGVTVCFPGGTPLSACTDLGCTQNSDSGATCESNPSCPDTEAGQCDDGVNNDAYQNSDTDCADAACAADPACIPTGACCHPTDQGPGGIVVKCHEGRTEASCEGPPLSGIYLGDGSTCCEGCPSLSGEGACCEDGAGGTCWVTDEEGCGAGPKAGIWQGVGTTCDPDNMCPAEPTFCPPPVPTVSEWGMVAMALLTLTAGTVVFSARRGRRVTA